MNAAAHPMPGRASAMRARRAIGPTTTTFHPPSAPPRKPHRYDKHMQAPSSPLILRRHSTARQAALGFTAIEILITIAILGVLAALAGPSFKDTLERWRVRQAVESMTATVYYARSEAIKRGGNIVIRKEPNNTGGCTIAPTNEDWGCGWVVFVDTNGNGTQQAGEETLQTYPGTTRVDVTVTGSSGKISVNRWGAMDGLGAKAFAFVPQGENISHKASAAICVSAGGRVRTVAGDGTC